MPTVFRLLLIALPLSVAAGCASIPAESVELSKLVGEMIASARTSHLTLAHRHFDQLTANVEAFALGEYKQKFLDNLRKLLRERDTSFKDLTFEQYDRAVSRVLRTRAEWVAEVQKSRLEVLRGLEEHYAALLAANAELTSLLKSAAELGDSRAAILERFGAASKIRALEDKLAEGTRKVESLFEEGLRKLGASPVPDNP